MISQPVAVTHRNSVFFTEEDSFITIDPTARSKKSVFRSIMPTDRPHTTFDQKTQRPQHDSITSQPEGTERLSKFFHRRHGSMIQDNRSNLKSSTTEYVQNLMKEERALSTIPIKKILDHKKIPRKEPNKPSPIKTIFAKEQVRQLNLTPAAQRIF